MSYETLLTRMDGATMIVTINRPKVLNALHPTVIEELDRVMDEVLNTESVKGAIITGAGEKAFVAGADISQINQIPEGHGFEFSYKGQQVFTKIERSGKPVIAAVNGFALGGGCELAMACHMRIASEKARFGQPEVNLGLIAGYGGTQRLVRLVGRGKATELLLTGDMVGAEEARQLGLVNHVVAPENLLSTALEILEKIYQKSPLAVAMTLEAIDMGVQDHDRGYITEATNFAQAVVSEDGREGTAAFLEKRKPNFTGK